MKLSVVTNTLIINNKYFIFKIKANQNFRISKQNEIYTDSYQSRKQMLLGKLKCVHCQSNYFNNGTFIDFNNCTFLCTSCYTKLNEEEES